MQTPDCDLDHSDRQSNNVNNRISTDFTAILEMQIMTCKSLPLQTTLVALFCAVAQPIWAERPVHSLNGDWQFRPAGEDSSWKTVRLPSNFESHEGVHFDGVGLYRTRTSSIDIPHGGRLILHFQAVATLAEVSINGRLVGTHLGGWTPFRFDITDIIPKDFARTGLDIQVRVDEKVGHNTQGFLPICAPHFGGIWQDAYLMVVPDSWIDDLKLLAIGNVETGAIDLQIPVAGSHLPDSASLSVSYGVVGQAPLGKVIFDLADGKKHASAAHSSNVQIADDRRRIDVQIPMEHWRSWSPHDPVLYHVTMELQTVLEDGSIRSDHHVTRAAFRTIETRGQQLLLNGEPIVVRGLLNWGYAPPSVCPSIDEQHIRKELQFAQDYGFNLMKFCLWVPPKKYLELADETGMLTWMEYPTWHSQWSKDQLPTLRREFSEFFHFDRNHPSVILRSLTCETGPSADLSVIRTLYDQCHATIPGAVIEDDSSWIGWNRVHDFYDDHPYGNNHTWANTLERLKQHIAERESKPLVLGEAITADTWVAQDDLPHLEASSVPFWYPIFWTANDDWKKLIRSTPGSRGLTHLADDSLRYAWLMRKYQIETYRREVPYGGYVVSVIRDFPKASMGLLDYQGKPKWPVDNWDWHRDSMLLLETEADRRSFAGGEALTAKVLLSQFSQRAPDGGRLDISLRNEQHETLFQTTTPKLSVPAHGLHQLKSLTVNLPQVDRPTQVLLSASLVTNQQSYSNEWSLWIMPTQPNMGGLDIRFHASASASTQELFLSSNSAPASGRAVIVAEALDTELLEDLVNGASVLLLPNGKRNSCPLSEHWFLRGGPFVAEHPTLGSVPRRMYVELQHFDLAGRVIPNVSYLDQVDPMVLLWDNHDIAKVKTHALAFETCVGQGRLLVSALNHRSSTNAAGQWLLGEYAQQLGGGPAPKNALSAEMINRMRLAIDSEQIDLSEESWQFKPDGDEIGLQQGWHRPEYESDSSWKEIRVGVAWEGAGFPNLDGWAWYRLTVNLPDSWTGRRVFISFQGVDDYYELFVNGIKSGSGGDIDKRLTAFEERKSHDVTAQVTSGQPVHIAIRVLDWQGAGGIFRPVWIGTAPQDNESQFLK
jgi:beta-galactosidase/beta-glucuronidase